jgi:transposase
MTLPSDLAGCQALIAELDRRLAELQEKNEELQQREAELKLTVAELLRLAFGRRRERYLQDPRQLALDFNDSADAADAAEGLSQAVEESGGAIVQEHVRNPKKQKPRNEALPAHLPRKVVDAEIPEELRSCIAHGERTIIGYDEVETLMFDRPRLWVLVMRYVKLVCKADPACGIASPERPTGLVEGNRYDASIAAEIITNKYGYHLPIYRQQDQFAGSGWIPSRSTLLNVLAASAFVIRPLVEYFRQIVLASGIVGTDDTTVTLLVGKSAPKPIPGDVRSERAYAMLCEALARGEPSITARLWAYRSVTIPLTFFDFTVSRARAGPDLVLADFCGKLMADCYSAYQGIEVRTDGKILRAACATHARRKVFEAKDAYPREASLVLARFQQIYGIETRAKSLSPDQRYELRQTEAKPLWDALGEWLQGEAAHNVLPKSKFGQALGYLRNHWDALQLYLTDGRMPADNNDVEQLMKQIALGRKNWLFIGSVAAGQRTADFFSLVTSAVRNDLDVWDYTRDVLERLLAGETDYEKLRPDVWRLEHPEAVRQYRVEERRDKADRKQARHAQRHACGMPDCP